MTKRWGQAAGIGYNSALAEKQMDCNSSSGAAKRWAREGQGQLFETWSWGQAAGIGYTSAFAEKQMDRDSRSGVAGRPSAQHVVMPVPALYYSDAASRLTSKAEAQTRSLKQLFADSPKTHHDNLAQRSFLEQVRATVIDAVLACPHPHLANTAPMRQ